MRKFWLSIFLVACTSTPVDEDKLLQQAQRGAELWELEQWCKSERDCLWYCEIGAGDRRITRQPQTIEQFAEYWRNTRRSCGPMRRDRL